MLCEVRPVRNALASNWSDHQRPDTGQRTARNRPLVQPPRGTQTAAAAQKAVASDGDGGAARGGAAGRLGRGLDGPDEVAADHDVGLDDRLAAEHDVLGADERGFARHLVSRVRLNVLSPRWSSRHVGGYFRVFVVEVAKVVCSSRLDDGWEDAFAATWTLKSGGSSGKG